MISIQDGRDYFVPNAFEVQKAMCGDDRSRSNQATFFKTLRLLLSAGFCLLIAVGCTEHPLSSIRGDVTALKSSLRISGETIVAKQDESLGILKENTTALAAIKSQIDTLKASQAESETGNGIGGDLSSDPPPIAETDANDSHASSPGMQPVKASAVELFVCSTASCAPCKRMWRDVDDGKLDGFVLTKVAPFDGMKSYPAIRFQDTESNTGWSVVYGYDEATRQYLRAKLLGEKAVASRVVCEPVRMSHSEMKALHDSLHGGGQWTWPGDLATHLATVHGVTTGGEQPVSGSFFPVSRQGAVISSRSVVRLNPYGSRFVGRSRTSSGKSCPTGRCP